MVNDRQTQELSKWKEIYRPLQQESKLTEERRQAMLEAIRTEGRRLTRHKSHTRRTWGILSVLVGSTVAIAMGVLVTTRPSQGIPVTKPYVGVTASVGPAVIDPSPFPVPAASLVLTGDHPLVMTSLHSGWRRTPGGLTVTSDGGRHWANTGPTLTGHQMAYVAFAYGPNAWMAVPGTNEGTMSVYRTSDGGAHWQSFTPSWTVNGSLVPEYMTFSDTLHGWLTTTELLDGSGGEAPGPLFATDDGGKTWHVAAKRVASGVVGFHWLTFISPSIGYTSGAEQIGADPGVTDGQPETLYRTTDGGATWSPVDMAWPTGANRTLFAPLFFHQAGTGVMPVLVRNANGLMSAYLYKTSDLGKTWSRAAAFTQKDTGGFAYTAVSANDVWITWGLQIRHTVDGGRNFSAYAVPEQDARELDFAAPKEGWMVFSLTGSGQMDRTGKATAHGFDGLDYTSDGGQRWTRWYTP